MMNRHSIYTIIKHHWILICILLLGFGLRVFFIHYDLPGRYEGDELFFVNPALTVTNGHADPHWYGAPGHTIIYTLAAMFSIFTAIINGVNHTSYSVLEYYQYDPTWFHIIGRLISVLAGTGTLLVIYLIGLEWNKRVAIFSALLTATAFYLVEHAHYIRPDILQSFFLLITVYGIIKIIKFPTRFIWFIVVGISFGLAITTKYPSLFVLLPILYVAIRQIKHNKITTYYWLFSSGLTFITCLATAPYIFLNFPAVWSDIINENRLYHTGHDSFTILQKIWFYVGNTLSWEVGTLIYLLALGMCGLTLWQSIKRLYLPTTALNLFILASIVSYIMSLSLLNLHWERWLIPILPLVFLLSAQSLDWLAQKYRLSSLIMSIIVCIILLAPGIRLTRTLYSFSHPHTQDLTRIWITENITHPDAKFVTEPYTPQLTTLPSDYVPAVGIHTLNYYLERNYTHWLAASNVFGFLHSDAIYSRADINELLPVYKNYDDLLQNSTLLYTASPNNQYTAQELLYANDLSVLQTLDIQLHRGETIYIYQFNP